MSDNSVEKSKIFIASSSRTLVLAEKLRDELATDFCQATLWSEEGRSQLGSTIVEMLEGAAQQYDFAVIILAKDDVLTSGDRQVSKARDNCVFEAGLFMSAIGRKRCFLVTSVNPGDLPSDLGGIIYTLFKEPTDLGDRAACAQAVMKAAAEVKDTVQTIGPLSRQSNLPLLSVDELFRRERPISEGGDLSGGYVVVCETQPWDKPELSAIVRHNIDNGTSYQYFFDNSDVTVEKVCLSLQVIAWSGTDGAAPEQSDFRTRIEGIKRHGDRVLKDLREICDSGRLRVSLVPQEQPFFFRIHNASDPDRARYYARYREKGFVPWTSGYDATSLWRSLRIWLADDTEDRIFAPLKHPPLDEIQRQRLKTSLRRSLGRFFPGLEDEIGVIFLGRNFLSEGTENVVSEKTF